MATPIQPVPAQAPPRMANGYVQMPGGYQPQGVPQQQGQPPAGYQMNDGSTMPLPPGMGNWPQEGIPQSNMPIPQRPAPVQAQPPQQQQPQFQQQPPQQQFAPAPVQYPQQPQQVAPTQPQGIDPNIRLSGPHIPANLQGRTLGEAMQIYGGMQSVILQQLHGQAPPAQPQQAAPPAPPQSQQQPPAGQQQSGWDWRNPDASVERTVERTVARLIDEKITPALAPIIQRGNVDAVRSARDVAAAAIGQDFAMLEPYVLARLQNAHPQALTNPEAWRIAATSVMGEMQLARQRGLLPQQQSPSAPGSYPAQQVPAGQPLPNLGTFFTEQPTMGQPTQGVAALTPQQRSAASAMGMNDAQYAAWAGMAGAQVAPAPANNGWGR